MSDTQPAKVYIYGSCVTRDGVEWWDDYQLTLAGYTARHSLLSAYKPANPEHFQTERIERAFLRSMAEADITSSAVRQMLAAAETYDVILWDLTDERLGVAAVPGGGLITRLPDYYGGGIYTGPEPLGHPLAMQHSAHIDHWRAAADRFLAGLESVGKRDALIVNGTPWADIDDRDAPVKAGMDFNELSTPYLEHLAEAGVTIAVPDPTRVVADSAHKWGPAPYHYVEDTYRAVLDRITEFVA